ncbi:hypothetical protein [Halegenticoccus tardaugens]|uniref:hypothetical protein n=1 Tax=Halegenticoccus tardaugens TaxID=2071624 RepID=UPI00100AA67A|nr:hypothetical protein [Halegenticoccus tardaugens]
MTLLYEQIEATSEYTHRDAYHKLRGLDIARDVEYWEHEREMAGQPPSKYDYVDGIHTTVAVNNSFCEVCDRQADFGLGDRFLTSDRLWPNDWSREHHFARCTECARKYGSADCRRRVYAKRRNDRDEPSRRDIITDALNDPVLPLFTMRIALATAVVLALSLVALGSLSLIAPSLAQAIVNGLVAGFTDAETLSMLSWVAASGVAVLYVEFLRKQDDVDPSGARDGWKRSWIHVGAAGALALVGASLTATDTDTLWFIGAALWASGSATAAFGIERARKSDDSRTIWYPDRVLWTGGLRVATLFGLVALVAGVPSWMPDTGGVLLLLPSPLLALTFVQHHIQHDTRLQMRIWDRLTRSIVALPLAAMTIRTVTNTLRDNDGRK